MTTYYCGHCKVRHPRFVQAVPVEPPSRLLLAMALLAEVAGALVVLLLCFGAIAYALPVLLEAMR